MAKAISEKHQVPESKGSETGQGKAQAETDEKKQPRSELKHAEPTGSKKFGDGSRDEVDEASWESFPASDPPGYNPGTIGANRAPPKHPRN